jgi:hypothetical protein
VNLSLDAQTGQKSDEERERLKQVWEGGRRAGGCSLWQWGVARTRYLHAVSHLCALLLRVGSQEKLEELEAEAERPDELEETPDVPDADMM